MDQRRDPALGVGRLVAKTTEGKLLSLESLNSPHRRRPVMDSTEEVGGIKEEEELPECSEGEVERDLGLVDRPKEPKIGGEGEKQADELR